MNELSPIGEAREISAAQTSANCDWPITSCYIDAWALVLASWGLDPIAALGVGVMQDYEADQFTFIKYQADDLERLYGVIVSELTIYAPLEEQIAEQIANSRVVLVEADGYYLPDTRATSYRTLHTKTTIGIDAIDVSDARLTYFHNVGHFELAGEDYAGVFRKLPHQQHAENVLPPYIEFVKRRWPPLAGSALTDAAIELLRRHLRRRPEQNPIQRYRQEFPRQMEKLIARPHTFHDYAFGNFRQLGANFELLGAHIDWLQARGVAVMDPISEAARHLSATVKAMQFKVARIANRGRFDACDAAFDALERDYVTIIGGLERIFL